VPAAGRHLVAIRAALADVVGLAHVVIDERERQLISASSYELRIWDLKASSITRLISMPCTSFNLRVSPNKLRIAVDCDDGSVWVWSRESKTVTLAHKHNGIAFGIQWVGDRICSGGWDGHVLCSSPDGSEDQAFDLHAGRIMWLAASKDPDFLIVTSIDGRVWKIDSAVHELYSHDAVPYRAVIAPDGTRVASCGLDGSLIVYDLVDNRIMHHQRAHRGAIHNISWHGDAIWTSGVDGFLRRWQFHRGALEPQDVVHEVGPFRLTKVFAGGWAANAGEGILALDTGAMTNPLRLNINKRIRSLDVSPDARYFAAATSEEIVIVSPKDRKLAILNRDADSINYASFIENNRLIISTITTFNEIQLDELEYIDY
jgi:WD40 repeat protein